MSEAKERSRARRRTASVGAKKSKPTVEGKRRSGAYTKKLNELKALVASLDGLRAKLAGDMLASYVRVYEDYEELNEMLEDEGLLIEVERGGENNRHVEKVKHPAFDMRRNCIAQMNDTANKIYRFCKDDEEKNPEPTDFDTF